LSITNVDVYGLVNPTVTNAL